MTKEKRVSVNEKLFEEYKNLYEKLSEKYRDTDTEMSRALRLFDIKLRLVLGIDDVVFNTTIAKVKTPAVKQCYVLLIKLTELWNVLEALFQYLSTRYKMDSVEGNVIDKMLGIKELKTPEVMKVLKCGFENLKGLYKKRKNFPEHFSEYYSRAKPKVHKKNKKALDNIMESLETDGAAAESMLNLIYIDRNLFYHIGEAVKMGMSYANRKALMEVLYNMLEGYVLTVINKQLATVT